MQQSQDLTSVFSNIKKRLLELSSSNNVEQFTLIPYPNPDPFPSKLSESELAMVQKYNVIPKEVYSVVEKLDQPPNALTPDDKQLRKKYLNILLQVIDEQAKYFKGLVTSFVENDPHISENYDAAMVLTKRIVNLLLLELDPVVCQTCKDSTDYTTYMGIGGIAIVVLILLSILVRQFM